jgi:hypothetical protein
VLDPEDVPRVRAGPRDGRGSPGEERRLDRADGVARGDEQRAAEAGPIHDGRLRARCAPGACENDRLRAVDENPAVLGGGVRYLGVLHDQVAIEHLS